MGLVNRIALSIDFSSASEVATRAAFRIAEMIGAHEMTLIHSVRQVVLPTGDQPKVRERLEKLRARIHESAEAEMHAMCARLDPPGDLKLQYTVVEGRPAEVIPQAAEDMQASLLLVGTHSRKGVRRWLKGSIAEAMLRKTNVPMLVLLTGGDEIPPDEELRALTHVLIAVDLGEDSMAIARAGIEMASSFAMKPKVVLLHVNRDLEIGGLSQDDPEVAAYAAEVRKAGEDEVRGLAEQCDAHGLAVEARVVEGVPSEVILEVAQQLPSHLIVMGTHGRDMASPLDVGSTTATVVRHSDVAVLVVPTRPDE